MMAFDQYKAISNPLLYSVDMCSRISSASGRLKAFSTCTSHLTAVVIFQGTMLFMYFRPSSPYSLDQD
ncbi:hypothetical protein U0070_020286, partial [Myodes glareolus]